MTFKIVDGREYFYQWDTSRQIAIDDPTISEVHFCNRLDNCSLVVEVVNGIANVPNILLQKSFDIRVFAYDGEATLFDRVFEVKARTQPSDYVYTETEIRRYEDLAQRIDEIERNGISEEVITEAVENYLDEHPVNLEGYATEEYVNEAVNNVSVDLSGYAKESYVDEAITQSVSGLAKKTDIPDVSKFITNIPSEYITESELNSKGYLTQHQDISGKADKNHTHSEYAKTKHTHDMADVSGLQSAIANRATQEDIDKAIELHNHNDLYAAKEHNHDDKYATRGHVHSYNDLSDKPEIPSIEGLASEAYVNAAIKNIEIPEVEDVDLSNYYTKEEIDTTVAALEAADKVESVVARIPRGDRTSYYLSEEDGPKVYANPSKYTISYQNLEYHFYKKTGVALYYVSEGININTSNSDEFIFKAIIIAIPSLDISELTSVDVASKAYVDEAIANIEIPEGGEVDLTNYYTKSEVDGLIPNMSSYYTKTETTQAIQDALNAIGVAEGGAY